MSGPFRFLRNRFGSHRRVRNRLSMRLFQDNRFTLADFLGGVVDIEPDTAIQGCSVVGPLALGRGSDLNHCRVAGPVRIGRWSSVNGPSTLLYARHGIEIGNFASIAHNVTLVDYQHHTDRATTCFLNKRLKGRPEPGDAASRGPIAIGSDVWIGAGAVVLSGATIGHGAVVGANSVVTGDVPPFTIVAGAPAKAVRPRLDEALAERLLALAWYDRDIEELALVRHLFNQTLTAEVMDQLERALGGRPPA